MASLPASEQFNCIRAISSYINKILKPRDAAKQIPGMKCLLLDRETKTMVSMVYSMNEILTKEVFLVETLDAKHEGVGHLKAICLIRPTKDNVKALAAHLREPKFAEYHIFFTSIVPQDVLRTLADVDSSAVVKQVQEFYIDYYAVNADVFSLNLGGSMALSLPRSPSAPGGFGGGHTDVLFRRSIQGLLSLLLSFKVKPHIRYQSTSEAARALASEVTGTMGGEKELFTFNRGAAGAPLLIIMDRRDDPVTPLLTQWTYQAMVHELLPGGIKNNTVDLRGVKGVSKDMEEVVVAPTQDTFFRDNMYANFGDVGEAVRTMLDEYSSQHRLHENVSSVEDMQRFVDKYPELKKKGLVVSKHVALMSEISRQVDARALMAVSEIEQNVACSDNPNDHFRDITALLTATPGLDPMDVLRLVMLYTLRYERSRPDKVSELRRFVAERVDGLGPDAQGLIDTLLRYAGATARGPGIADMLFGGSGGMLSKLSSQVRRGLAGVQNVFTQHQPLLTTVLDQLAKGRLSKTVFPFVGPETPPGRLSTVIVFYVGGCTFEEAAKVAAINAGTLSIGGGAAGAGGAGAAGAAPVEFGVPVAPATGAAGAPFRVVLGGTAIHSSKSFLAELKRMQSGGSGGSHVSVEVGGGAGGVGF